MIITTIHVAMRHRPLYALLADTLLASLSSRRLGPGDRLPTEEQLIREHRVSRTTVRQALDILRQRNLITRIAGRGTFVNRPSDLAPWTMDSAEEVLDVVTAHTDLAILAWRRVRTTVDIARRLREFGDYVYVLRGVRHREGMPLCYAETYTTEALGRQLNRRDVARATVLGAIEGTLHVQITNGIEEISGAVADRHLASQLGVPRGAPLLLLEFTFFDSDAEPVEYAKAWYRADQFKRRTTFSRRQGGFGLAGGVIRPRAAETFLIPRHV